MSAPDRLATRRLVLRYAVMWCALFLVYWLAVPSIGNVVLMLPGMRDMTGGWTRPGLGWALFSAAWAAFGVATFPWPNRTSSGKDAADDAGETSHEHA
jgi:hypothetical protein